VLDEANHTDGVEPVQDDLDGKANNRNPNNFSVTSTRL
jgi:hypothetical protein